MSAETEMDHWRRRIDEIDRDLTDLLAARARCAIQIGRVKARYGLEVYDPQREAEVMSNVRSRVSGFLTEHAVERIFERIIDETRRLEREHRKLAEAVVAGPEESGG